MLHRFERGPAANAHLRPHVEMGGVLAAALPPAAHILAQGVDERELFAAVVSVDAFKFGLARNHPLGRPKMDGIAAARNLIRLARFVISPMTLRFGEGVIDDRLFDSAWMGGPAAEEGVEEARAMWIRASVRATRGRHP